MALEIKGHFGSVTVDEVKPIKNVPKNAQIFKGTHTHYVWENGKGIFFKEHGEGKTIYRTHWTAELYSKLKQLV